MQPEMMTGTDQAPSYPHLFREMMVRSAETALASIDPEAQTLADEVSARSLHALTLALKLPEAWPATQALMLTISPYQRWQGEPVVWMDFLAAGIAAAEQQGDRGALAKLHRQFGWFCRVFYRLEQAEEHARRAYELALEQDDTATRIDALYELAATAGQRLNFAAAQSYVDEVFGLTDAEDPRRALPYSLLGHIATQQAEYDIAIQWYLESLRLHTATGQLRLAAQNVQHLAWIYVSCAQYDLALTHFQSALKIWGPHASSLAVAELRNDLAWCYMLLGDYEQALEMCRLAEPVFVNLDDKRLLSVCYNHYGMIHGRMGHFQEAERLLLRSVELARELHVPFEAANALESLGRVYRDVGALDQALATWQEALGELKVLDKPPQRLYNMLVERMQEITMAQGNQAPGSPEVAVD